jgi:Tfp pilus assembly protein PilZ
MTKERSETRLEKKLLVNIDKDGMETMGLTANISRHGMFVATTEFFPLDSEVSILIGVADDTLTVKGKVIWIQEGADGASEAGVAAGIKITEAPDAYFELVDKMLSNN